jgi:hypothetical protein
MGQEIGEPALDAEGYSGKDWRTTIFDFWSLDTLRRWLNNGKCGVTRLNKAERTLRKTYAKVLNLVNESSAVREGKFFDLMYVNGNNAKFDTHSQYAYMRCSNNEAALIVVNFANHKIDTEINIPQHAFDYLHIAQGQYDTIDLLSGEKHKIMLNANQPVTLKVNENGAVILRFNLSQLA